MMILAPLLLLLLLLLPSVVVPLQDVRLTVGYLPHWERLILDIIIFCGVIPVVTRCHGPM